MSGILIRNATIINEGNSLKGDVLIKDEFISAISMPFQLEPQQGEAVIDATNLILIPGVIDDHVHFREPGLTHKGDILSESKAAAAGGITSFMDMPNTAPQTTTLEKLKEKYKLASEKSLINYSFYLGATNTNLSEIMKADPESVCGIKIFMGSSTGCMLTDDEEYLKELFRIATLPVAVHCEDEHTIRKNTAVFREKYGENIPFDKHPLIRSRDACFISSSLAVRLAQEYNTQLHILHLSTADEIKLLTKGQYYGNKKITAEATVHHLWFDDSFYNNMGPYIKWNPAIKTRFDRDSLTRAVNNDLIDVIATDHAPHTSEEKSESYLKSPSGGPMVQHSLVAVLEMWHKKIFSLEKIVEKMCHNPAMIFKIKERGFIREGYRADLCLVDPDNPWTVSKNNILYKCGWSPFEGTTFRSKIVKTIVNGNIVYDNGILNHDYRGQKLVFER